MKKNQEVVVKTPKEYRIKMSKEEKIYQGTIAFLVGLVVLACLIPFLYVVGMSFTSEGEMVPETIS